MIKRFSLFVVPMLVMSVLVSCSLDYTAEDLWGDDPGSAPSNNLSFYGDRLTLKPGDIMNFTFTNLTASSPRVNVWIYDKNNDFYEELTSEGVDLLPEGGAHTFQFYSSSLIEVDLQGINWKAVVVDEFNSHAPLEEIYFNVAKTIDVEYDWYDTDYCIDASGAGVDIFDADNYHIDGELVKKQVADHMLRADIVFNYITDGTSLSKSAPFTRDQLATDADDLYNEELGLSVHLIIAPSFDENSDTGEPYGWATEQTSGISSQNSPENPTRYTFLFIDDMLGSNLSPDPGYDIITKGGRTKFVSYVIAHEIGHQIGNLHHPDEIPTYPTYSHKVDNITDAYFYGAGNNKFRCSMANSVSTDSWFNVPPSYCRDAYSSDQWYYPYIPDYHDHGCLGYFLLVVSARYGLMGDDS